MTPGDIARLLAACAMYDFRSVEAADAAAWFHVIGDLDYDDAMEAVRRHYQESTDRMMPAHVHQGVRAIRAERARHTPSDARQLPGPFERDLGRELRTERGMASVRQVLAQVTGHLADTNDRPAAIDQLRAITAGPAWDEETAQ